MIRDTTGAMAALPALSLVMGGAASGKSALAERLVLQQAARTGRRPRYLATAQAFDAEMRGKIDRHRDRRGPEWHLVEEPLDVGKTIASLPPEEILLFDCATVWLSNLLLAERDPAAEEEALARALAKTRASVVIVSNEVGSGLVPENALARKFREAQGGLNQRLAARAGMAVLVVAGLPLVLKGSLPDGAA